MACLPGFATAGCFSDGEECTGGDDPPVVSGTYRGSVVGLDPRPVIQGHEVTGPSVQAIVDAVGGEVVISFESAEGPVVQRYRITTP